MAGVDETERARPHLFIKTSHGVSYPTVMSLHLSASEARRFYDGRENTRCHGVADVNETECAKGEGT